MALPAVLLTVMSAYGIMTQITPLARASQHWMNRVWSNEKLDPGSAVAIRRRRLSETFDWNRELESQGFDDERQALLYQLTQQLLNITELIALYRRGEIKDKDALYIEADKVGWVQVDVDYMLRVTEVIPSAGDIIRYAVREVYSPEIAEAFGQYEELPKVLKEAAADLKAAGLPEDTFKKEWAAHWMLPSILQGFEMLHRGEIPAKSTEEHPLSLQRLMIALDIMPAWREPLTAISYNPFTRVDVRRMHKLGVLDTKEMFISYADVGFSPYAPGHEHVTVVEAFECEVCRHESKVGKMTNFTLVYNNDPEAAELTIADKERQTERDLTKSEVLSGYYDGLLESEEVTLALTDLEYSAEAISYYIAKTDYDRDKAEAAVYLKYLHDAYVRGINTYEVTVDKLGELNLPDKQVQALFRAWDLDKAARAAKPTKSELSSFVRADIISPAVFKTEMQGLGYPDRYIKWYEELIERGRAQKETA